MPDAGEIINIFRTVPFTHPNDTLENQLMEHPGETNTINYRLLSSSLYPTDYTNPSTGLTPATVVIILDGAEQDMRITLQSSVAEGSIKDIPAAVRDLERA